MLNINEHVIGMWDLKNDVAYRKLISLENVQSYTIAVRAYDVSNLGTTPNFPTDGLTINVLCSNPLLDTTQFATSTTGITLEETLDATLSETRSYNLLTAQDTPIDAIGFNFDAPYTANGLLISDADFGYKGITVDLVSSGLTTGQIVVVATISTTKGPN